MAGNGCCYLHRFTSLFICVHLYTIFLSSSSCYSSMPPPPPPRNYYPLNHSASRYQNVSERILIYIPNLYTYKHVSKYLNICIHIYSEIVELYMHLLPLLNLIKLHIISITLMVKNKILVDINKPLRLNLFFFFFSLFLCKYILLSTLMLPTRLTLA